MVNTKHDAYSYERLNGYQREIFDGNALYDGFRRAEKGSDWKPEAQRFEMTYLLGLAKMQPQIKDLSYEFKPSSVFSINERGKTRIIHGEVIEDRIVKHSLCDEVLNPCTNRYLIFDNGASQVDKGITFTRNRLEYHLRSYYREHGNNKGYILLIDYSKYYDNILHDYLLKEFKKYVSDPVAIGLVEKILKHEEVDVSYMTDEEYECCMQTLFNSNEYYLEHAHENQGKRFMPKHLNIGDQLAQTAGILYPTPLDNFIQIVKSATPYGRYMDDSYVINESKEFLQELLKEIIEYAKQLGITVNEKKTRICKLSEMWRFLQIQYSLTDTGRVIKKINQKRLTGMRRKMKKLAPKKTVKEFTDWYKAWFKNHYKIMSKQQRRNMDELFEKEVQLCIQ